MIRAFRVGDEARLWDVFHSSIHTLARDHYPVAEREAWAPHVRDAASKQRWVDRMRAMRPFVVEFEGTIVAYADLRPDGTIDHFYVAGGHGRRGFGTALMEHLVATARTRSIERLTADVSLAAQSFFRRFGFVIVAPRTVVVRGVALSNAAMRLSLSAG